MSHDQRRPEWRRAHPIDPLLRTGLLMIDHTKLPLNDGDLVRGETSVERAAYARMARSPPTGWHFLAHVLLMGGSHTAKRLASSRSGV